MFEEYFKLILMLGFLVTFMLTLWSLKKAKNIEYLRLTTYTLLILLFTYISYKIFSVIFSTIIR